MLPSTTPKPHDGLASVDSMEDRFYSTCEPESSRPLTGQANHQKAQMAVPMFKCSIAPTTIPWLCNFVYAVGFAALTFAAIVAFILLMFGLNESCYSTHSAAEDWNQQCGLKLFSAAISVSAAVALSRFALQISRLCQRRALKRKRNVQSFFWAWAQLLPVYLLLFSCIFLVTHVLGYPGMVWSKYAHMQIKTLSLDEVVGTDATGVFLQTEGPIAVAVDFTMTGEGHCVKQGAIGINPIQRCILRSTFCAAPILESSVSHWNASLAVIANTTTFEIRGVQAPAGTHVKAWAVCEDHYGWGGEGCVKSAGGRQYLTEPFLESECFRKWLSPMRPNKTAAAAPGKELKHNNTLWISGYYGQETILGFESSVAMAGTSIKCTKQNLSVHNARTFDPHPTHPPPPLVFTCWLWLILCWCATGCRYRN
jgi:hypothetical protein